MHLVDEDDVALGEVGEDGDEVALAVEPGPGDGDQPRVHLARDDVRERRLAEPGRPCQQHVVDRLAALLGRRERDRELLAHDLLPDELVELARPQRAVGLVLVAARRGRADEALLLAHAGPPRRSAASASLTRCSVRALGARERGLGLGDGEAERDERVARRQVRIVGCGRASRRRRAATASSAAAPSLSRNSTTMRSAVRLPMPETDASSARSPVAMPRCSVSTG